MQSRNQNFKIWALGLMVMMVGADPGANLLNLGCTQYMVDNASVFKSNLNSVLSQLKGQLSSGKYFATATVAKSTSPVFTLVQCRNSLPKMAVFGLARLLPDNKSHISTKIAGTLGYTAPEYAIYGQLSEKIDVYAYGVVVLEIISGQRSNEATQDPDADYLLKRAWRSNETEMHIELVDESLNPDGYDLQELKKVMEIALLCTQSTASLRPTMSEVVVLLKSKDSMPQRSPTRPAFTKPYGKIRNDTSTCTGSSTSIATASISQVSGR